MKYLCLIYDDEKTMGDDAEGRGGRHHGRVLRVHRRHQEERPLHRAARRCSRCSTATTVRVRNGKVSTTTDGPFAETKEQLGGFYLIEATDLNDAIQVAARIPSARSAASRCGRWWTSQPSTSAGAGGRSTA